ncbi:PLAC8 family-domain-containing protein [Aspergillus alliaceus]|uniref:PLAC8 family-domain-containing protein n=1 Tax=Petromyces alliaceus TaxID=209559 RepID=A0A5N7BY20_PETAA|nr:PLAC8 family-domain-containing protein [Aspergillus alliaceus]KAB8234549.1 PLAC8 family-domain-containing protein [Aspergillus alliaceus]KAE8386731.1 PLAC8 family-domain-containing protein [Aspergillus alliaceus]
MARQLRLNTSVGGNQRYSFLETPLEMHAPGLRSNQQQQSTPPPPQPLAVSNPDTIQGQAAAEPVQPQSLPPLNEKALYMQQEAAAPGYPGGPNIEDHPANHAPFADAVPQQHDAVVPDYSYAVPPPHSPGPLPTKTYPETPSQVARSHTVAIVPDTNPLQSPQLPYFPGPPTASGRSCTPLADDVAAYHRPGQISHPNQHVKGGTWSHGLCECPNIWTCCLGILCPCILYGKTQYRLSRMSRKEDPTNMLGHETCNESCTAMALLCGCQWLMATVQHRRTRKAYGIPGDIVSDCVRATCCTCCTLIQDENEIRKREEERASTARTTGAALVSPYFAPPQMSYGPSLR